MKTYDVLAKRWTQGWELHITRNNTRVGITQCPRLTQAVETVYDYIHTVTDIEPTDAHINISYSVGTRLDAEVARAQHLSEVARAAVEASSRQSRKVIAALTDKGLKQREIALVLGISQPRVTQLSKPNREAVRER